MNKTNKIAILGILALFAVLAAIPAASAQNATYYFKYYEGNSVPEGYCHNKTVGLWINTHGLGVSGGQVGIKTNASCVDITSFTFAPHWDLYLSSWNCPGWSKCWDQDGQGTDIDWIIYQKLFTEYVGDILIGNFTIHCNSTEYCKTDMNLTCGKNCYECPIAVGDKDGNPVPYNVTHGTFECGTPPTFEKELVEGWNLISLPLTNTTNMTVANIIDKSLSGKYDALYRYDAVNKSWVEMGSSDVMENGVGYFIHMTAAGTWNYSGVPYESIDINLEKGLNCIGWVNETGSALPDALNSITGKYNYVARWNVTSQSYEVYESHAPDVFNDFWTMGRGEGYWIAAKEDCTLSYTMP